MSPDPAAAGRPGPRTGGAAAAAVLRPARGDDQAALAAFVAGLSPRSRYLRFFTGAPSVTPAVLRRMAGAGGGADDRVDALVAVRGGLIAGHAMGTDLRGPSGALVTEAGVIVADAQQRRGIGSALLRALAGRAQARGATGLTMEVLAENYAMLALIGTLLPGARTRSRGPYVTVDAPLPLVAQERVIAPERAA